MKFKLKLKHLTKLKHVVGTSYTKTAILNCNEYIFDIINFYFGCRNEARNMFYHIIISFVRNF